MNACYKYHPINQQNQRDLPSSSNLNKKTLYLIKPYLMALNDFNHYSKFTFLLVLTFVLELQKGITMTNGNFGLNRFTFTLNKK